ncbi:hypothetical protein SCP_1502490 [Sparassis crispa]|uniref:Uncharacterized protein n=1 Tax=Sparassis crispa TaxID=139825 RepID=A0A401H4B6_9APHY|nr:hypothetical protein SCP_1502490 [Sparassis crispa]GBE89241.1 hypothetical protein SCP_1502490 [Sparassis crispa]
MLAAEHSRDSDQHKRRASALFLLPSGKHSPRTSSGVAVIWPTESDRWDVGCRSRDRILLRRPVVVVRGF